MNGFRKEPEESKKKGEEQIPTGLRVEERATDLQGLQAPGAAERWFFFSFIFLLCCSPLKPFMAGASVGAHRMRPQSFMAAQVHWHTLTIPFLTREFHPYMP